MSTQKIISKETNPDIMNYCMEIDCLHYLVCDKTNEGSCLYGPDLIPSKDGVICCSYEQKEDDLNAP